MAKVALDLAGLAFPKSSDSHLAILTAKNKVYYSNLTANY